MSARFIVPLLRHVRKAHKVPLTFWIILVRSIAFIEAVCKLILAAMSDQPLTLPAYTETSTARHSAEISPPFTVERLTWLDSILKRKSVSSLNAAAVFLTVAAKSLEVKRQLNRLLVLGRGY